MPTSPRPRARDVRDEMRAALLEAVEVCDGVVSLARRVEELTGESCTYQAVQSWIRRGRVASNRTIAVEKASCVSRHRLRGDLYPQSDVA